MDLDKLNLNDGVILVYRYFFAPNLAASTKYLSLKSAQKWLNHNYHCRPQMFFIGEGKIFHG
jgi:hypothetical protein